MDNAAVEPLEETLDGWKEKIAEVNRGSLEWDRDLIFSLRTQRGYEVEYDANMQWGCSPTETLLMSVAGCMGIDVVFFLRKMKAEINSFKMEFSGTRNPEPPQYYRSIEMNIRVSGSGLTPKKLERAIALSQEKYCSVYHSLRKDIEVGVNYEIIESDSSG
ncbi:MAG: OsmC family protein [Nitrospirota bacterium]|nr:OsmC family protein [Nitrospirota bacterium]